MNLDLKQIIINLGIKELSPMQLEVRDQNPQKDLILLSPTGSGKTVAYMIQLLKAFSANDSCLVIVPSRELAIQTHDTFKRAKTGLKTACCYGGRPASDERHTLAENHDIIIGTPGRITDHINSGSIKPERITFLAIDEFDKALEMGFKEQIETIYKKLNNLRKKIFISATYSDYFKQYIKLDRQTDVIDYRDGSNMPHLTYHTVHSPETDKADTLMKLLHDLGDKQSIVFLNYRDAVERLSSILSDNGIYHVIYHGGMEQMDREKALSRFKGKSVYTMITTDLAARGLDIDGVDAIIHYHLPVNEETFLHRNGRSARWQAEGCVFTIINERKTLPEWMPESATDYIIKDGNRPIPKPQFTTIYIGKGKFDKISKGDIMGFLCKKGGLGRDDIGTIIVKEKFSFAAIKSSQVRQTITNVSNEKLKGKKVLIEIANR